MNRNLTHLGTEDIALHANKVAYIKEFLKHRVIHCLILARTNLITFQIKLDTAVRILKLTKGCRSHDTTTHDTTANADMLKL